MRVWPSDRVGKAKAYQCAKCLAWFDSRCGHACDTLIRGLVKFTKRKRESR